MDLCQWHPRRRSALSALCADLQFPWVCTFMARGLVPAAMILGAAIALLLLSIIVPLLVRGAASWLGRILDSHEVTPEARAWYAEAMRQRAERKRALQRYRYAKTHHEREREREDHRSDRG